MGKLLTLLVGAMIAVASTMLFSVQTGSSEADERVNEHAAKILAREVALTGLNEGMQRVFDSYEASGNYTGQPTLNGDFDGGSYQVSISTAGTSVTLKSVGQFRDARHTLSRSYDYVQTGGTVPEFMDRPITCDGNFVTKDDFTLSNAFENTNVHANGNLRFESGDALITGFGHYNGNLELLNGQSESEIFQPTENPGGLPLTQQVAEIDVPVFNASSHLGVATSTYFSDVELSGDVFLGSEQSPQIWYVAGNVKTKGAVTFHGFGVIMATGNFEIEHNVSTNGGSGQSSVGFYTEGNISIKKSSLNMAGQWFLNGNVEVEDNTTFSGSITATGNCYFDKSFNMAYTEASSAITEPIWSTGGSGPATLQLAGAQEW